MEEREKRGKVLRSVGAQYGVLLGDGQEVECRLRGRLRLAGTRTTNPVAVGDVVTVSSSLGEWQIVGIDERRNCLVRRSVNLSKEAHVLAANVDQAVLVCTLVAPPTTTVFTDRFLASAEAYDVPIIVCFNKVDLCAEVLEELEYREAVYGSMGYPVLRTSATTGEGLEELRGLLRGRLTAFAGHSGVGKTSLLNALAPGLDLPTQPISLANDAGRHTTTYPAMYRVDDGDTWVVDTPGVRGFGLIDIAPEEVGRYFRDIFKLSQGCKYGGCTHTHEPGCAVRQAYDSGTLAPSRYESYLNIMDEATDTRYRNGARG